jgi:hypothetical protein
MGAYEPMRWPATRYTHSTLHAAHLRPPRSTAMAILVSFVFIAVFTGIALVATEAVP